MLKFRVELWRVMKFILISAAADLLFACIGLSCKLWLDSAGLYTYKTQFALVGAATSLNTVTLVLLHRRFTFRASGSMTGVLLGMFVAANLWTGNIVRTVFESLRLTRESAPWLAVILAGLWLILSYLLQRYGFYKKAIDTNRLAQRRHTR